ncbi:MAG TPA: GAF domain-containing protein [Rhizomicrobium sp.]|nr:GAF domain-containing protein [Rhizomicrobium sp.]
MPEDNLNIDREYLDPGWRLLDATRERLLTVHTLEEIVEIVRATARGIVSADGACFVLREGDTCFYLDEDAISPLWKGQRFPLTACVSGWAMIEGKTAAIDDISTDARVPQDVYRKTFVKSLIMAPVGNAAAIGAYWRERSGFSGREVALLESLARAVDGAMRAAKAA